VLHWADVVFTHTRWLAFNDTFSTTRLYRAMQRLKSVKAIYFGMEVKIFCLVVYFADKSTLVHVLPLTQLQSLCSQQRYQYKQLFLLVNK